MVEYFINDDAVVSNVGNVKEFEDEQEMRAMITEGAVNDNDLSVIKSMHATE